MKALQMLEVLTTLEKEGYGGLGLTSIKTVLVMYELGELTIAELATFSGIDQNHMMARIANNQKMHIYTKGGSGRKSDPTTYRLNAALKLKLDEKLL